MENVVNVREIQKRNKVMNDLLENQYLSTKPEQFFPKEKLHNFKA